MDASPGSQKHDDLHAHRRVGNEQLHLISKLRWIGMEQEATRMHVELRRTMPGGGVLTGQRDTD
jgi:hypothetical protein